MMKDIEHPDGVWHTTKYEYKGRTIMIKSRIDHGIKAHCFYEDSIVFTQRFKSINPMHLLKRMKDRIDMWIAGDWIPKKLRK